MISMDKPAPGLVSITPMSRSGDEDCVSITIAGPDGQNPHIRVNMTHEAFGKILMGNGFQPCEFVRWQGDKS